jgi:hypothetical protein
MLSLLRTLHLEQDALFDSVIAFTRRPCCR